ncbi:MIF4G domain containing protein [Nitzschia inconspicua]|uniref:MIF4G domain containing protein n=1 Tax=Nitzschia inconspicua TaxID=303405 RepID=A0A9K3LBG6_9STRA|nr:MIF4G domain containing protein [Nitzschia inconspicua]
MPISTQIKARKEERKLKRKQKQSKHTQHNHHDPPKTSRDQISGIKRVRPELSDSASSSNDVAAGKNQKKKQKKLKLRSTTHGTDPFYGSDTDPSTAALLEQDDQEIAKLEKKLGLSKRKEKDKLYKEYSMEGYGDDFGDFLEGLDDLMLRLKQQPSEVYDKKLRKSKKLDDESEEDESSDGEELVPMKGAFEEMDEDDSVLEELQRMQEEEKAAMEDEEEVSDKSESDDSDEEESQQQELQHKKQAENDVFESDESSSDSDEDSEEDDHDVADTYRPAKGEDIYGKSLDLDASNGATSKYVPPHLRKKQLDEQDGDEDDLETRRTVTRSLNSALNRLSEDTLISVAQQLAGIYSSNPTQVVHEEVWKNAKGACVELPMLMTGLIPVYTACLTGVHFQTGDTIQVAEAILEKVVVELWQRLDIWRKEMAVNDNDDNDSFQKEIKSKHICNLILVLGYLYNYNVVHCSLMYDVFRQLIENFSEVDIECLLILLSHCGRSLRSDDPLALKEIVLLVQKKKAENSKLASSSRAEYMISAIMDLKNNRRKKQDNAFSEKAGKFRKLLGQIKSAAAKSGVSKASSEASLRISLEDILNAETKGRWWRVGASWVGNQYRFSDESQNDDEKGASDQLEASDNQEDEVLLKLANKLRMNTDRKRSIFCIIMGGTDCEDTFEKLCRSSLLQNRSERDVVRVLLECCGHEKSYNKFYGHLAARICEYQPQSRFSLQIAYWDAFKQFDSMNVRKAANLAKLLFHLVVTHHTLKLLPVIKRIDISEDDMDQTALIFLTLLVSSILEYHEDPVEARALFAPPKRQDEDEVNEQALEEDEGVRAGLLLFFMETLKKSPKNKKGSRFHKNFKAVVKELDSDGFESML